MRWHISGRKFLLVSRGLIFLEICGCGEKGAGFRGPSKKCIHKSTRDSGPHSIIEGKLTL